ncbi:MAG: tRNA pseudouridine(54/55) synthase Pus10 [Candidatus Helarchaeota archaeon]
MVLELAKKIILENIICHRCLGRQFALLISGGGISNFNRGFAIKTLLLMGAHKEILNNIDDSKDAFDFIQILAKNGRFIPAAKTLEKYGIQVKIENKCDICQGIMDRLPEFAEKCVEKLKNIEFNNFLVGSKFAPQIVENEDRLRAKYGLKWGETIKGEFNREVGKIILRQFKNKTVEFGNPEIVAVINTITNEIELNINPLYIYGRYLKFERGIPQTHWTCKNCNGKGCEECDFTGTKYETSIEELITTKAIELCEGSGAKFHGAGREDIDALMLGSGRPFVMEIKDPKKRFIDLKHLEKLINEFAAGRVQVKDLEFSDKDVVRKIKASSQLIKKTYRAKVELDVKIDRQKILDLENKLSNIIIEQKTPTRVLHRRANKTRKKQIYSFKIEEITENGFIAIITSQGGTYIKELISGDNGRTRPSVSELLGNIECKVIELDVLVVDNPNI